MMAAQGSVLVPAPDSPKVPVVTVRGAEADSATASPRFAGQNVDDDLGGYVEESDAADMGGSEAASDEEDSAASGASTASRPVITSIPSHRKYGTLVHRHELPRKALHVSIGFLTLWLYTQGVSLQQVSPVLAALFCVIGLTDVIRFQNPRVNRLYVDTMGFMMREREVSQSFNGVIWYLLGIIVVFELFPKDISVLAVLLLSWADTAASTFGRAYGRYTPKLGNKSLAGSLAAFAVSAISAYVLYGIFIPSWHSVNKHGDILWSPHTSYVPLPVIMLVTGFAGAISEATDVIDDNFSIPVLSATLMWLFVTYTNKPLQIM